MSDGKAPSKVEPAAAAPHSTSEHGQIHRLRTADDMLKAMDGGVVSHIGTKLFGSGTDASASSAPLRSQSSRSCDGELAVKGSMAVEPVLITANKRLKMFHRMSSMNELRSLQDDDDDEQAEVVAEEPSEDQTLNLTLKSLGDTFAYTVSVDRDEGTEPTVGHEMAVQHIGTFVGTQAPVEVGDRLVAVDGVGVHSPIEFENAVKGKTNFDLTLRARKHTVPDDGHLIEKTTVVEFDLGFIAGREDAGSIEVELNRRGNLEGRVEWEWSASNGTVPKGLFKKLTKTYGKAVFEAGEEKTSISLDIVNDPTWNCESVYFVTLAEQPCSAPDGVTMIPGATRNLNVYSVNMVRFPAGVGPPLDGSHEELMKFKPNDFSTTWGFWLHNRSELPRETMLAILYSLVPGWMFYINMLSFEALIDCGLKTDPQSSTCTVGLIEVEAPTDRRHLVLWAVVICKIAVMVIEHFVDHQFRGLKLGGKASRKLRVNMFSTMLQLSEEAKESFDAGDIEKCLDTEVESAIKSVWLRSFQFVRSLNKMIVTIVLSVGVLIKNWTREQEAVFDTVLILIVGMTFITLPMVFFRTKNAIPQFKTVFDAEENWAAFVAMSSMCQNVILRFKKGWKFQETFRQLHNRFNGEHFKATSYMARTIWFLSYIIALVEVVVILLAGFSVQRGALTVGGFLVLVRSVTNYGKEISNLSKVLNGMITGVAAVYKIAEVLNSQTRRRKRCLNTECGIYSHVQGDAAEIARHQVTLKNVWYRGTMPLGAKLPPQNRLSLTLPCNSVICFGDSSLLNSRMGVHTVLTLIEGEKYLHGGSITYPGSWKALYVPREPILFDGTLMYNLAFGCENYDEEVVWDLCRSCGMSSALINQGAFDIGNNGQHMKNSDRVVVSIVRALLYDVDVLLISSGLDALGERNALRMLRRLRLYMTERGLPGGGIPHELRHEKTIVYTSRFRVLMEQATHMVSAPGQRVPDADLGEGVVGVSPPRQQPHQTRL